MIEVEKKFQPTEQQLSAMLRGAEFLGDVENSDEYFDTPEFLYFRRGFRLRRRNAAFELKIDVGNGEELATQNEEITDEGAILERLGFSSDNDLATIVAEKMQPYALIKTKRAKYTKDGFTIDIDQTDFGYDMCEIELLVASGAEIADAENRIIAFAEEYCFSTAKLPGKMAEYLRRVKPELYQKLYS